MLEIEIFVNSFGWEYILLNLLCFSFFKIKKGIGANDKKKFNKNIICFNFYFWREKRF